MSCQQWTMAWTSIYSYMQVCLEFYCDQADEKSAIRKCNLTAHISLCMIVQDRIVICVMISWHYNVTSSSIYLSIHDGLNYYCDLCNDQSTMDRGVKQHISSMHVCLEFYCDQCDDKSTLESCI